MKVDKKVTIVNGRLVYNQQEQLRFSNEAELIKFLQENGVKLKEFIYGDKEAIIQSIMEKHE